MCAPSSVVLLLHLHKITFLHFFTESIVSHTVHGAFSGTNLDIPDDFPTTFHIRRSTRRRLAAQPTGIIAYLFLSFHLSTCILLALFHNS